MHEFWPDLQHTPLVPDDPQLQAEFSKILPAVCARLVQGSRICYIRVDEVGGWVGCWWVGGWWGAGGGWVLGCWRWVGAGGRVLRAGCMPQPCNACIESAAASCHAYCR